MDESNLSQPHSWSRVCNGNVYSHRFCWRCSSRAQHCDSSPWENLCTLVFSLVCSCSHLGLGLFCLLHDPKLAFFPCFLCMALSEGQVLDYLGGVNHRGLADLKGHVPSPLCPCCCAMEEPIPNPTLASLKALDLCSSPGQFLSITKNDLIFFCFLVISCWDV